MKTIFFDLGGVLVYFSHERMCEQVAAFTGLAVDQIKSFMFEQSVGEAYLLGHITSHQLHQKLSQISGKQLDFEAMMHAIADIFYLNAEMIPLLESLKAQGKRLFLLSNTCEAHFEYIKKNFDFLNLFDEYILSYKIHLQKPDKQIYHFALKQAATPKEDCFYTDDLPEFIQSAREVGIDSHLFIGAKDLQLELNRKGILL